MVGLSGKGGVFIHDHSYGIESVTGSHYLPFFNNVFSTYIIDNRDNL